MAPRNVSPRPAVPANRNVGMRELISNVHPRLLLRGSIWLTTAKLSSPFGMRNHTATENGRSASIQSTLGRSIAVFAPNCSALRPSK